MAGNVTNVRI